MARTPSSRHNPRPRTSRSTAELAPRRTHRRQRARKPASRLALIAAAAACFLALAQPASAATPAPFEPGERWCALGDSITHSGRYHHYIYLFYGTRYPERPIDFFNAGISGDNAGGALQRLDADVLRHRPTLVTVMFGMNDVARNLYAETAPSAETLAKREAAIARFATNLRELAGRLRSANLRAVMVTPSIFDDTAEAAAPNLPGVDAALARCSEITRSAAAEFGFAAIDLHGPMQAINRAQQAKDPRFSLVGPDRVHPEEPGHFVMAYLILKAQGVTGSVAELRADADGKPALEFSATEPSLPFPVPAACKPALALVPFTDELNRQTLRVDRLPEGDYALAIDGEPAGVFPRAKLAAGINLAALDETPQLRQARAVAALDEKRFGLVRRLRTLDYVEAKMGRTIGDPSPFDWKPKAEALAAQQGGNPWIRAQYQAYLEIKPAEATLREQLADTIAEIRASNRPKPHRFTLQKTTRHER
jgi:lysophospholipase L1-like esterase